MRLFEFKGISQSDLDQVEKYADRIFAKLGIDVEFTKHFLQRANDERNNRPITTAELIRLFKQEYKKHGQKISNLSPGAEAVMKDMDTDINVPFKIVLNTNGELDLVAKTILRKSDFKTSNREFTV
tara:strand:- start:15 stop:392 length:378 start_codon:yes stop_codon:yes gene_type:complete